MTPTTATSGLDIYTYSIIKTGDGTFTIIGNLTNDSLIGGIKMYNSHVKESPIISLTGMGGGLSGYSLLSSTTGGGTYEISRSLRFNPVDKSHLYHSKSSSNRKTWTWLFWVKKKRNKLEQS